MAEGGPPPQRLAGPADLDQIGAHRIGDVLGWVDPRSVDSQIKPPLYLTIGVLK